PFRILRERHAGKEVDAKHKAEPVLAVLPEPGPGNRATQPQLVAFNAGLLAHLPAEAGDDIFVGVELAAQTVELPEMCVVRPAVAVDHQYSGAVGREDVAERGQDRCVRHGDNYSVSSGSGSGSADRMRLTWAMSSSVTPCRRR